MDWSKVDAALAGALTDADDRRYVVFVHLVPGADPGALARIGLEAVGEGTVRTATVSATDLDRLSDQPEVSHLRLSRSVGLSGPA